MEYIDIPPMEWFSVSEETPAPNNFYLVWLLDREFATDDYYSGDADVYFYTNGVWLAPGNRQTEEVSHFARIKRPMSHKEATAREIAHRIIDSRIGDFLYDFIQEVLELEWVNGQWASKHNQQPAGEGE